MVKEFLQTKGVDVAKFTGPRKNAQPVSKRRLSRMFGGEITTPIPRTNAALRETLRAKTVALCYLVPRIEHFTSG